MFYEYISQQEKGKWDVLKISKPRYMDLKTNKIIVQACLLHPEEQGYFNVEKSYDTGKSFVKKTAILLDDVLTNAMTLVGAP